MSCWSKDSGRYCVCLRRLGDLAVNNLLQRVDTLAIGAQGVLFKESAIRSHEEVRCSLSKRGFVGRSRAEVTYHKMHSGSREVSQEFSISRKRNSDRL